MLYDAGLLPSKIAIGRDYRKYSLEELGDKLGGRHWTTIQKWEKGINQVKASTLATIADVLELEMGFFFSDQSPEDADIRKKSDEPALKQLTDQIKHLEAKITPKKSESPAVLAVEHYPEIEKMVNRIRSLDDAVRLRILDKIDAYIDALEDGYRERAGKQKIG